MARIAALVTLLALAAGAAWSPASAQSLPGLNGGALTEQDLASGNTVLVVFASWSPKCRDIASRLDAIEKRWRGKARIVGVNFQEERSDLVKFFAQSTPQVPVYLDRDGSFSRKYAVTTLPSVVVFQGGKVTFKGKLPDNVDDVLAGLLG